MANQNAVARKRAYTPPVGSRPVGIRKKPAIKFGRKTVQVQVGVGHNKEMFTIHEDLLCRHSLTFRAAIQRTRKAYEDCDKEDQECIICQEPLEPGVKELTFCSLSCGTNFHHHCIAIWKNQHHGQGGVKCPMCRQNWEKEDKKPFLYEIPWFRSEAFAIYTEWLYYGHISVEDNDKGYPHVSLISLAYRIGLELQDDKFCKAVLEGFFEVMQDSQTIPTCRAVRHAYTHTPESSPLRRFLVQLFIVACPIRNLEAEGYPAEFYKDLVWAMVKRHNPKPKVPKNWDLQTLREEYCTEDTIPEDSTGQENEDYPAEFYKDLVCAMVKRHNPKPKVPKNWELQGQTLGEEFCTEHTIPEDHTGLGSEDSDEELD